MSYVNETETCHTKVLPARPRPSFIAPWSHKRDGDQDSLIFETKTKNPVVS